MNEFGIKYEEKICENSNATLQKIIYPARDWMFCEDS